MSQAVEGTFVRQPETYNCRENAIILTKLEECLLWTKARADARAKRGVLDQNIR